MSCFADLRIADPYICTRPSTYRAGERELVQSMKAWSWTLFVCCGFVLSFTYVTSTCVGNSCAEEHETAASAGLLGATVSAPACNPKSYPRDGSRLQPVSMFPLLCYLFLALPVTLSCSSQIASKFRSQPMLTCLPSLFTGHLPHTNSRRALGRGA